MDWFLYDNSLGHERVKLKTRELYLSALEYFNFLLELSNISLKILISLFFRLGYQLVNNALPIELLRILLNVIFVVTRDAFRTLSNICNEAFL